VFIGIDSIVILAIEGGQFCGILAAAPVQTGHILPRAGIKCPIHTLPDLPVRAADRMDAAPVGMKGAEEKRERNFFPWLLFQ